MSDFMDMVRGYQEHITPCPGFCGWDTGRSNAVDEPTKLLELRAHIYVCARGNAAIVAFRKVIEFVRDDLDRQARELLLAEFLGFDDLAHWVNGQSLASRRDE